VKPTAKQLEECERVMVAGGIAPEVARHLVTLPGRVHNLISTRVVSSEVLADSIDPTRMVEWVTRDVLIDLLGELRVGGLVAVTTKPADCADATVIRCSISVLKKEEDACKPSST
jgi:hypothetical protein